MKSKILIIAVVFITVFYVSADYPNPPPVIDRDNIGTV